MLSLLYLYKNIFIFDKIVIFLWGPTIFGPAPFIRWGLKAQAEEGYGPDTVMQVQK